MCIFQSIDDITLQEGILPALPSKILNLQLSIIVTDLRIYEFKNIQALIDGLNEHLNNDSVDERACQMLSGTLSGHINTMRISPHFLLNPLLSQIINLDDLPEDWVDRLRAIQNSRPELQDGGPLDDFYRYRTFMEIVVLAIFIRLLDEAKNNADFNHSGKLTYYMMVINQLLNEVLSVRDQILCLTLKNVDNRFNQIIKAKSA